jgi:seryl-tRNA synthetase
MLEIRLIREKPEEVRQSVWGNQPTFDFKPRDHVELATGLGLIDYERGVKLGGSGYWLYRGAGARMEWAVS